MANRTLGPTCQYNAPQQVEDGTSCGAESPAPGPLGLCTKKGSPDSSWGYWDVVVWRYLPKWMGGNPDLLRNYKDAWVRDHRDTIKKLSASYGLPAALLGGVAWIEAGGKPYSSKIGVYEVRKALRLEVTHHGAPVFSFSPTKKPELTSVGPVAIQLRRAAEVMGLKFDNLSEGDKSDLLGCLQNADNDLAIVAKHLSQLRQIDFPNKPVLGKYEIRIIASRYNRGPELSLQKILQDTSYGDFLVNKIYERVQKLLE